MINKIRIGNFRVFKELTTIDAAPITIVTGKNNSGKSSVLKALGVFLDINVNKSKTKDAFKKFNLGGLEKVCPDKNNSVFIGINDLLEEFNLLNDRITLSGQHFDFIPSMYYDKDVPVLKQIRIDCYNGDEVDKLYLDLNPDLNQDYVSSYRILNFSEYFEAISSQLEKIINNTHLNRLSTEKILSSLVSEKFNFWETKISQAQFDKFDFNNPKSELIDNIKYEIYNKINHDIINVLHTITIKQQLTLQDFLKNDSNRLLFKYKTNYSNEDLIFFREFDQNRLTRIIEILNFNNNKQYYEISSKDFEKLNGIFDIDLHLNDNYSEELTNYGKLIISIIATNLIEEEFQYKYRPVSSDESIHNLAYTKNLPLIPKTPQINTSFNYLSLYRNIDKTYNIDANTLVGNLFYEYKKLDKNAVGNIFLKHWLNKFEIGDDICVDIYDDTVLIPYLVRGEEKISFTSIGYGYCQVITIILQIITGSECILIEEPESNLHPNLQSKLADLLIYAIKASNFETQFIIETHSEYFIRRLQYWTAKKNIDKELTAICYIDKGLIKNIKINSDGTLSEDFNSGFMDEADNLSISLFNIQNRAN